MLRPKLFLKAIESLSFIFSSGANGTVAYRRNEIGLARFVPVLRILLFALNLIDRQRVNASVDFF